MAKARIPLRLPDGTLYTRSFIKGIRTSQSVTMVMGEDFDDHELWAVEQANATLIGTLTEAAYQRVRQSKTKSVVQADGADFAWNNGAITELNGEAVTAGMLKWNPERVLTAVY